MDLEKLNEELKNKDLSKESILRLMNLKINNDRDKLISKIDKLDHKLEASIGSLKSETKKLSTLDSRDRHGFDHHTPQV